MEPIQAIRVMEVFKGRVYKVEEEKQITDKFRVKMFVLEVTHESQSSSYTHYYPIQASNKYIELLDGVTPGMDLTVSVSLNGRKWNKKDGSGEGFMVTLSLIKLDKPSTKPIEFSASGSPMDELNDGGVLKSSVLDGVTLPVKEDDDFSAEEDDLPFMWLLLVGITGLSGLSHLGSFITTLLV